MWLLCGFTVELVWIFCESCMSLCGSWVIFLRIECFAMFDTGLGIQLSNIICLHVAKIRKMVRNMDCFCIVLLLFRLVLYLQKKGSYWIPKETLDKSTNQISPVGWKQLRLKIRLNAYKKKWRKTGIIRLHVARKRGRGRKMDSFFIILISFCFVLYRQKKDRI